MQPGPRKRVPRKTWGDNDDADSAAEPLCKKQKQKPKSKPEPEPAPAPKPVPPPKPPLLQLAVEQQQSPLLQRAVEQQQSPLLQLAVEQQQSFAAQVAAALQQQVPTPRMPLQPKPLLYPTALTDPVYRDEMILPGLTGISSGAQFWESYNSEPLTQAHTRRRIPTSQHWHVPLAYPAP